MTMMDTMDYEVPGVRNMDRSAVDAGDAQAAGMREPSQVHYPRKRRDNWPFKFYQENGKIYENIPRRQQRPRLDAYGEALL